MFKSISGVVFIKILDENDEPTIVNVNSIACVDLYEDEDHSWRVLISSTSNEDIYLFSGAELEARDKFNRISYSLNVVDVDQN